MKASAKMERRRQHCVPDPAEIAFDITANGPANAVTGALLARNPGRPPTSPAPRLSLVRFLETDLAPLDSPGCPNGTTLKSTSFFNRVDSFIGKIDQNFNTNNMLTGRYYFGDSNQSFPFAQLAAVFFPDSIPSRRLGSN